jgi:hypothetical protein
MAPTIKPPKKIPSDIDMTYPAMSFERNRSTTPTITAGTAMASEERII